MMNLYIKMTVSSFVIWLALLGASLPFRDAWMNWINPERLPVRLYTILLYVSFAVCIISVTLTIWAFDWTTL